MKTCEFNVGGKACGKRAAYGTGHPRCLYACDEHADTIVDLDHDVWRIPLDAETLALLLSEELERDNWGDIDPYVFKCVAAGDGGQYVPEMREALERVCSRWAKGEV